MLLPATGVAAASIGVDRWLGIEAAVERLPGVAQESLLLAYVLLIILPLGVLPGVMGVVEYPEKFERFVGSPLDRFARRRTQAIRDRWLKNNLDQILGGTVKVSLYLRPFVSSGSVHVLVRASWIERLANPGIRITEKTETWEDLEAMLAEAVLPASPLVGLALDSPHYGSATIKATDATWQHVVTRLFDAAELIFILPSSRPGTAWELDRLMAQPAWRCKTVVIVPAATTEYRRTTRGTSTFRHGANAARAGGALALREDALSVLGRIGLDSSIVESSFPKGAESLFMMSDDATIARKWILAREEVADYRRGTVVFGMQQSTLARDRLSTILAECRIFASEPDVHHDR